MFVRRSARPARASGFAAQTTEGSALGGALRSSLDQGPRGQSPRQAPAPLALPELVRAHQRLGALYQIWDLVLHARAHEEAIRRAAIRNGDRFLEVTVGRGSTFVPLVLKNPQGENHGVGMSEAALRRCRSRLEQAGARNYHLRDADVRSLPFPAESFDLILSCYLLDSLDENDQGAVIGEFRRLLRPGGRLVLVQMASGGLRLYELLARHAPLLLGGCRPVNLGPRLLEAGFRDVSRLLYKRLRFASELVRGVKI